MLELWYNLCRYQYYDSPFEYQNCYQAYYNSYTELLGIEQEDQMEQEELFQLSQFYPTYTMDTHMDQAEKVMDKLDQESTPSEDESTLSSKTDTSMDKQSGQSEDGQALKRMLSEQLLLN